MKTKECTTEIYDNVRAMTGREREDVCDVIE